MAAKREYPYSQFSFRVSWDGLDERTVEAGFQEVSGLGQETTVAEYRAGTYAESSPLEGNGTYKTLVVILKRGVIDSGPDLYAWINEVRQGKAGQPKEVTVKRLADDRETEAMQWKLIGARPVKYTGPSLSSKGGTDLAVEELVLATERIEES